MTGTKAALISLSFLVIGTALTLWIFHVSPEKAAREDAAIQAEQARGIRSPQIDPKRRERDELQKAINEARKELNCPGFLDAPIGFKPCPEREYLNKLQDELDNLN